MTAADWGRLSTHTKAALIEKHGEGIVSEILKRRS
jgi:hypothetical protein